MLKNFFAVCLLIVFTESSLAAGNNFSQSFYDVKRILQYNVFHDHRKTLYCDANFSVHKDIELPHGFLLPDLKKVNFKVYDITKEELALKARRMEWEHIVPAQNFGKTFPEWYQGSPKCVSKKGKRFKGRSCAEQQNEEFRYMFTDMYNLYPSIGAVNYLRANFNFTQFGKKENVPSSFGGCNLKISRNLVEPRDEIKGLIARTYLYMEKTYPRFSVSAKMRPIIETWNRHYPVSRWECKRAFRIEQIQGNENMVVKEPCLAKNWYKD